MNSFARNSFVSSFVLFSACVVKPPAIGPNEAVATRIRINHANPPRIGYEYYPEASRHAGEQGVCKVSITVMADGKVKDVHVTKSTGYPALDAASVNAFTTGTLLPATENGHPIDDTAEIPVTWTIRVER